LFLTIKADPEIITTILKYPVPKNIRELRSFLGLNGYYRKLVQNYAKFGKTSHKIFGRSKW